MPLHSEELPQGSGFVPWDNFMNVPCDSTEQDGLMEFDFRNEDFGNATDLSDIKLDLMDSGNSLFGANFISLNVSPGIARQPNHQPEVTSTPTVPATKRYCGNYGFEVRVEKQKKETKTANWAVDDHGLFVKPRVPCPFMYRTSASAPEDAVVRVLPIYSAAEHVREPVRRCPRHITEKDPDEPKESEQHLIRCSNSLARYEEDPNTHRLSVVLPLERNQGSCEWITNSFQFLCFNSCPGGINRRPVMLVFTLEHNREVIGRSSLEVRICACPGRDMSNMRSAKPLKRLSVHREMKYTPTSANAQAKDIYTLVVKGRTAFEMLNHINHCLEVQSRIKSHSPGDQMQTTSGRSGQQPLAIPAQPFAFPPDFGQQGTSSNPSVQNSRHHSRY